VQLEVSLVAADRLTSDSRPERAGSVAQRASRSAVSTTQCVTQWI